MLYSKPVRPTALFAMALMAAPLLAGCGGSKAPDYNAAPPPAPKQGLSTKQKLVGLAGAAALYYVYKTYTAQKQNAPANVRDAVPPGAQLYRSESTGGIYYRDPKTHQAHWLTIPNGRIQVPEDDYNKIMSQKSEWGNMPVPTANTPPPGSM
jgi:hypothetical protein